MVINRTLLMLSGSYHIPNVQARGRQVYTNNPWGSAARGAGPPQVNFALECGMDMLADKLGTTAISKSRASPAGISFCAWPLRS